MVETLSDQNRSRLLVAYVESLVATTGHELSADERARLGSTSSLREALHAVLATRGDGTSDVSSAGLPPSPEYSKLLMWVMGIVAVLVGMPTIAR
jgi:hypothetical protein